MEGELIKSMIPPVEERQIRSCYNSDLSLRCVHCIIDETGKMHCNFNMDGESGYSKILGNAKMPNFNEIKTKRYLLSEEELKNQPCIYHLTKTEYSESMIGY
ncbi:hypothetical protein KHC33_16735 [Methanospirillum sp. J.3.6.1-F.2.7.3]|uniref:Uncharacterized protein n=1 Tax=Methanospirillum purgamenti TaxID=2834276 RepID=A0A8E7AZ13_9EURY|nr:MULTISPECIES: hypothetical protein [Methanospirillum]MDX8549538.1 hypothetical protein [Methanospirillum hungatei]QVV88924.1 hypothetical protein KHC33_16735 [Methanospirillum sp. J.3.6.1-F.2.7.3]